jgi:hypothetical protein
VIEHGSLRALGHAGAHSLSVASASFREKYNRSTMENARQLQCKALRRLQKIRRHNNNGNNGKNNAQNNGNNGKSKPKVKT